MRKLLSVTILFVSLSLVCVGDAFIKVPLCRQAKDYTCGVASMQSVLAYYGLSDMRQDQLEKALKTNRSGGTKYKNMLAYAQKMGFDASYSTEMTLEQLKSELDNGQPVIVVIQAWTHANPPDYENDWKDGHYVVAIGYDSANIYFMDPAILGNYAYMTSEEFLIRWHDSDTRRQKLIHFGLTIKKGSPVYDPDSIQHID